MHRIYLTTIDRLFLISSNKILKRSDQHTINKHQFDHSNMCIKHDDGKLSYKS